MKKTIIFLMLLALACSLSGCATQDFDNKNQLKKSPCASLEVEHV